MLRKLLAAANPFRRSLPAPPPREAEPASAAHEHSFSCACPHCEARTASLTAARLKRQG